MNNMGSETSKPQDLQDKSSGDEPSQAKSQCKPPRTAKSSGSKDAITYSGFDISALPEELIIYVLMFLPAEDVVKRCSCVCKYWLALCRDQSFWRRKCEQERKYVPGVMGPPPEDFMAFYFKHPYNRNLLRNTHGESLQHWNSGNRHSQRMLSVETTPAGSHPIKDYVPAAEIQGDKVQNWVTSYIYAEMSQKISLLEEGCSEIVLDELRPPIYVSAWYSARWDCGSKFHLKVDLLDKDNKSIDNFQKEFDMTDGALRRMWHKVDHTFTNYRPGLRSVVFCMGGVDTQYWAGNYGAKFTLPFLHFVFEPDKTKTEINS